jgi:hypothetical protein
MASQSRRYYKSADRALLWSRSGGMCCFEGCNELCVQEANEADLAAVIGQIGHIEAKSDSGPRANPDLSDSERDLYPNLILLCPTHHRLVDAQNSTHTKGTLRDWKAAQEARFREFLAQEMGQVTFAELEIVTQALMNSGTNSPDSITVIPPLEKMARNGLTDQTAMLITIGLLLSRQVKEFIEAMGGLDDTFVTRLTSGFVTAYQAQVQDDVEGDALFEAMRLFSSQGRREYRYQSAGLAILVYLFEACEVFEQ